MKPHYHSVLVLKSGKLLAGLVEFNEACSGIPQPANKRIESYNKDRSGRGARGGGGRGSLEQVSHGGCRIKRAVHLAESRFLFRLNPRTAFGEQNYTSQKLSRFKINKR